jgi:hypothetical protein
MTEPDRASLRWRRNIHRVVAWLKAPSDEEDHASFQLDVLWADGVERLPEVYALETSRPGFDAAWGLLRKALGWQLNVEVMWAGPPGSTRPDGKTPIHNVVVTTAPPRLMKREEYKG